MLSIFIQALPRRGPERSSTALVVSGDHTDVAAGFPERGDVIARAQAAVLAGEHILIRGHRGGGRGSCSPLQRWAG